MLQPLFVRPLTSDEEESLKQQSTSAGREEAWRAKVILMSAEGKTALEISQDLGFHLSNVKKWIRKFNRGGLDGIAAKKRGPQGGPRPKFTLDQVEQILKLYALQPVSLGYRFKNWTPQKLATAAIDRGIVDRISHVTVRQLIKRSSAPDLMDAAGASAAGSDAGDARFEGRFQMGQRALARADYEAAVQHFYAALGDEPGSPEQEATTRSLLSKALEEVSRYEEAYSVIEKYEEPQTLASLSTRMRARMKLCTGWINSWLRKNPKAIASLNEAMKLFLEMQDYQGVSEVHYALGRTYTEINEFRIARDHLLAAIRTTSDSDLLARVYNKLGVVDFFEGAFTSSKEHYLKALELAEGSSEVNLIGVILLNIGTTTYHLRSLGEGDPGGSEESTEYLRRAIECLEKGGHKDALALAYNNLGDNLFYNGSWEEAIESLHKAIEIARQFKQPNVEATAGSSLAEILCGRGQYADAEERLKVSLEVIAGSGDKWIESYALRLLASVYRGQGQDEAAVRTLRQALQLSTSIGDLYGVTLAQVGLAEFHLANGGLEQAREYLELAQGRLKEEKYLIVSGLIQRLTGQLESAANRYAEANQHIAQSISIFTATEIVYEVARSQYEMGRLLLKAHDLKGAEANLTLAREAFQKIGAQPYLDLAEKALAAISSGQRQAPESIRVTPPSSDLLIERLMEASASREVLVQELAAVIYENFPVEVVMICKSDESGRMEPLAARGLGRAEADGISSSLDVSGVDAIQQHGNAYLMRMGEAMRSPIFIYIRSGEQLDLERLGLFLKLAKLGLENCSLRASARGAAGAASAGPRFQTIMPGFIVGSPSMFDVIDKIHKIRTSGVTVLITGESGTGKELVARAIHKESARAHAIFLPFNCTATPKEIIDSQLFGHRRGAFTGATANYPGIIKAADGGTLFLDEIGDLSLEVQPKLMRFLQESEIQPLGETKPMRVDVRVLAATNSDLERAVEDGRFREDLFHRLNIIRIHVPPLRDRREEVPALAAHFLEHFCSRAGKEAITLTGEAIAALTDYEWPGNVRQLKNEIERMVAYASDGERISIDHLSPEVSQPRKHGFARRAQAFGDRRAESNGRYNGGHNGDRHKGHISFGGGMKLKDATAELERRLIKESLDRNNNNLSRTAIELGLSRRGLRLKLNQLEIKRD
jgi:hydrogenase-4 transcriptional activator